MNSDFAKRTFIKYRNLNSNIKMGIGHTVIIKCVIGNDKFFVVFPCQKKASLRKMTKLISNSTDEDNFKYLTRVLELVNYKRLFPQQTLYIKMPS